MTSDRRPVEGAPEVWAFSSQRPAGGDPAVFYAIECDGGFVLVDAGWRTEQTLAALTAGLGDAGGGLGDVRGVVLTHMHPDHFGLAGELKERYGAWIAASPDAVAAAMYRYGKDPGVVVETEAFLRRAGVPEDEAAPMVEWRRQTSTHASTLEIDVPLADRERVDLGDRSLVALATPGHAAGHLAFHDADHDLLFVGDVILPQRNPPIGSFSTDLDADPISDFFASLDRLSRLDGCLVLPGHGEPFTGPAADARRLRAHHERRMQALTDQLASGPSTVWDAALAAPWSAAWEGLSAMAKLLALGKVNAHLAALVHRGDVRRVGGDPVRHVLAKAGRRMPEAVRSVD